MFDVFNQFFDRHPEWKEFSDLVVMPPTATEAIEEWPDVEDSELLRHPDEDSRFGVTKLALYIRSRRLGQSHRFAEMVATQRPPQCMTDDVFFAGMRPWAAEMTPQQRAAVVRQSKARGFVPPPEAVYHSSLARFPNDPEAFVTKAMGRGYIKKLCERRGWACEGAVNVKSRPPEKDLLAQENCIPMAEDLIRSKAKDMIREDPGLRSLPPKRLREKVIAQYGPSA